MKKLLFIIIPALLIALVIYLGFRHINDTKTQKGALQVTSSPTAKVYLNDKYIGRTPISKTEAADMIQSGEYNLKLEPLDKQFSEYQEKVTITTGTLTVVDRKFRKGPLSEGYVISLTKLDDDSKTELEVLSFPSGSTVDLDANTIGETPINYKKPTESDHMLRIKKDGYKEKTVRIRTPKGYRLSVIAYLSVLSDQVNPLDLPVQQVSDSEITPSVTPSTTPSESTVLILDTPTGFLRVRSSYSLSSSQISTVDPGQTFPLLSEQSGWLEIKLEDGKTGWVSAQYAKIQN